MGSSGFPLQTPETFQLGENKKRVEKNVLQVTAGHKYVNESSHF